MEAPPKAGSKADGLKTDFPKDVPKAELKADVKALTGKPVSKNEQIHDEVNVASKDAAESSKAHPSSDPHSSDAVKTAGVDSKATSTVKKVIVEAGDDDDTPPLKAAKVSPTAGHAHASSVMPAALSHTKESEPDPDVAVPDEKAGSDAPPAGSAHGQPLSHLSESHKSTDLDIHEAKPTASGDRSLIRALGLKIGRIVIDPGHGGHDTGTIGPNGLAGKRSGARSGAAAGQAAGDTAGRGSGLHAQGRYVHSSGDSDGDRQPAARRPVYLDPRQLEPGSARRAAWKPIT